MNVLRNISINLRLWALSGMAVLCIAIIISQTLSMLHQSVLEVRRETARHLVDGTHSLVDFYYNLEQNGLPREEAQRRATENLMAKRYDDGEGYFFVFSEQYKMISHPVKPNLIGTDLENKQDARGDYHFQKIAKTAQQKEAGGFVEYYWEHPEKKIAMAKVSYVRLHNGWGWIIGTGVHIDDIKATYSSVASKVILLAAVLVLILLAAMMMISTSIRTPLSNVASAMKSIAQGEGDLTQRLPSKGQDEITGIAKSFNTFIERIQKLVAESRNTSSMVANLTQEISALSKTTTELTGGQQQQTDLAATGSHEMSLTIQEVASNAERAAAAAKDADSNASRGMTTMNQAQEHIAELAESIQNSCNVIRGLREETDAIGSVLDVIRGIAEQTNLLALNAAIEAARAGEQGRGFAVVADEVRTLASRTQESTEEINNMISRLQEQAANAVVSMEQSTKRSEETSEMSKAANEAIASISAAVATMSEMNIGIASAVEEQSAAANEISTNIVQISDASGTIANNSQQMADIGLKLTEGTQSLSGLIARFKV